MRRPRYLHGPQYSLRSLDVKGTLGVLASVVGPCGASSLQLRAPRSSALDFSLPTAGGPYRR